MLPAKLTPEDRAAMPTTLPAWTLTPGRDAIARSLRFADFPAAFGFMAQVALAAERIGHHPEWFNALDRVDITLTTYDVGGLSVLDLELAAAIDRIAAAVGSG